MEADKSKLDLNNNKKISYIWVIAISLFLSLILLGIFLSLSATPAQFKFYKAKNNECIKKTNLENNYYIYTHDPLYKKKASYLYKNNYNGMNIHQKLIGNKFIEIEKGIQKQPIYYMTKDNRLCIKFNKTWIIEPSSQNTIKSSLSLVLPLIIGISILFITDIFLRKKFK